eukprot:g14850.t1
MGRRRTANGALFRDDTEADAYGRPHTLGGPAARVPAGDGDGYPGGPEVDANASASATVGGPAPAVKVEKTRTTPAKERLRRIKSRFGGGKRGLTEARPKKVTSSHRRNGGDPDDGGGSSSGADSDKDPEDKGVGSEADDDDTASDSDGADGLGGLSEFLGDLKSEKGDEEMKRTKKLVVDKLREEFPKLALKSVRVAGMAVKGTAKHSTRLATNLELEAARQKLQKSFERVLPKYGVTLTNARHGSVLVDFSIVPPGTTSVEEQLQKKFVAFLGRGDENKGQEGDFAKPHLVKPSMTCATAEKLFEELRKYKSWVKKLKPRVAWAELEEVATGRGLAIWKRITERLTTIVKKHDLEEGENLFRAALADFIQEARAEVGLTPLKELDLQKRELRKIKCEGGSSAQLQAFHGQFVGEFEIYMRLREEHNNPVWRIDDPAGYSEERAKMLKTLLYSTGLPGWIVTRIESKIDGIPDEDLALKHVLDPLRNAAETKQAKEVFLNGDGTTATTTPVGTIRHGGTYSGLGENEPQEPQPIGGKPVKGKGKGGKGGGSKSGSATAGANKERGAVGHGAAEHAWAEHYQSQVVLHGGAITRQRCDGCSRAEKKDIWHLQVAQNEPNPSGVKNEQCCPTFWAAQEGSQYSKRRDQNACISWVKEGQGTCGTTLKLARFLEGDEPERIRKEAAQLSTAGDKKEFLQKQVVPMVKLYMGGMVATHSSAQVEHEEGAVAQSVPRPQVQITAKSTITAIPSTFVATFGKQTASLKEVERPNTGKVWVPGGTKVGQKVDLSVVNKDLHGCERFTQLFPPWKKENFPEGYQLATVDLKKDLGAATAAYFETEYDGGKTLHLWVDLAKFRVTEIDEPAADAHEVGALQSQTLKTGEDGPYVMTDVIHGDKSAATVVAQKDSGCLVNRKQQCVVSADFAEQMRDFVLGTTEAAVCVTFGRKENEQHLKTKYVKLQVGIPGVDNGGKSWKAVIDFLVVPGLSEKMAFGYAIFKELGLGFERAPLYLMARNVPKSLWSTGEDGMLIRLGETVSMGTMIVIPPGDEVEVEMLDVVRESMDDHTGQTAYILDVSDTTKTRGLVMYPGPTVIHPECLPECLPVSIYNPNPKQRAIEVKDILQLKKVPLPKDGDTTTGGTSGTLTEDNGEPVSEDDDSGEEQPNEEKAEDHGSGSCGAVDDCAKTSATGGEKKKASFASSLGSISAQATRNDMSFLEKDDGNGRGNQFNEDEAPEMFVYGGLRVAKRPSAKRLKKLKKQGKAAEHFHTEERDETARTYGGIGREGDRDLREALQKSENGGDLSTFLREVAESDDQSLLTSIV